MKEIWHRPDPHNDSPRAHYYILYRTEDAGECQMETVNEKVMDMVATLVMSGADVYAVLPRY